MDVEDPIGVPTVYNTGHSGSESRRHGYHLLSQIECLLEFGEPR